MLRYARFLLAYPLLMAAAAGNLAGGPWMWTGVALLAVMAFLGDEVLPRDSSNPIYRHPAILDGMLYATLPLIVLMHLGLLLNGVDPAALPGWTAAWKDRLGMPPAPAAAIDLLGGVLSTGFLVGIAATNVAHELMHRRGRTAVFFSRVLLTFSFDLPLVISHLYGHHVEVGIRVDHTTARRGESSYGFVWRSTMDGNRNAWRIERRRLSDMGAAPLSWRNRFVRGHMASAAVALAAGAVAGWQGVLLFLVCAAVSKSILELINYIQHYGLVRQPGTPIELRHSWNSDAVISSCLLFNTTRHSHHHADPQRPYWALQSFDEAPALPRGYLTSLCIALVPPWWKRHMVRPLADWDAHHATLEERELAQPAGPRGRSPIRRAAAEPSRMEHR